MLVVGRAACACVTAQAAGLSVLLFAGCRAVVSGVRRYIRSGSLTVTRVSTAGCAALRLRLQASRVVFGVVLLGIPLRARGNRQALAWTSVRRGRQQPGHAAHLVPQELGIHLRRAREARQLTATPQHIDEKRLSSAAWQTGSLQLAAHAGVNTLRARTPLRDEYFCFLTFLMPFLCAL